MATKKNRKNKNKGNGGAFGNPNKPKVDFTMHLAHHSNMNFLEPMHKRAYKLALANSCEEANWLLPSSENGFPQLVVEDRYAPHLAEQIRSQGHTVEVVQRQPQVEEKPWPSNQAMMSHPAISELADGYIELMVNGWKDCGPTLILSLIHI